MAVLAAAALLDELMGRNRNIAPNEKVKELNWEDPEVMHTQSITITFTIIIIITVLQVLHGKILSTRSIRQYPC